MSSKRTKAKTTKKRPQRATSNVFAMFDQSQIQEFKEAFNMIDQNRDGFVDKEDLHDMLASLGELNDWGLGMSKTNKFRRCYKQFSTLHIWVCSNTVYCPRTGSADSTSCANCRCICLSRPIDVCWKGYSLMQPHEMQWQTLTYQSLHGLQTAL